MRKGISIRYPDITGGVQGEKGNKGRKNDQRYIPESDPLVQI